MTELRQQIEAIIKTCETVIASQQEFYADSSTTAIANAILNKAKEQMPDDEVLKAAILTDPIRWSGVLSTMQLVLHSLPVSAGTSLLGARRSLENWDTSRQ
jgi:hypothetical protein